MKDLTEREREIILFCLKSLSTNGSYEGGEVRAFNEIKEEFGFDLDYDEMFYLHPNTG